MPGNIAPVSVSAIGVNYSFSVVSDTVKTQNAVLTAVSVTVITENAASVRL